MVAAHVGDHRIAHAAAFGERAARAVRVEVQEPSLGGRRRRRDAVEHDQVVVGPARALRLGGGQRQAVDGDGAAQAEQRAVEVQVGAAHAQDAAVGQGRDDGVRGVIERQRRRRALERDGPRRRASGANTLGSWCRRRSPGASSRRSRSTVAPPAAMSIATDALRAPKFCTTSAASTALGSAGRRRAANEMMPTLPPRRGRPTCSNRREAHVQVARDRAPRLVAERAVADQHHRRPRTAAQDRGRERQRARQIARLLAGRDGRHRAPQPAGVGLEAGLRDGVRRERRDQRPIRGGQPVDDRAARARAQRRAAWPTAVARRHRRGAIDEDHQAAPGAVGGGGARIDRRQQQRGPAIASASISDSRSRRRRAQLVVRRGPAASSHSGANDTTTRRRRSRTR